MYRVVLLPIVPCTVLYVRNCGCANWCEDYSPDVIIGVPEMVVPFEDIALTYEML